MSITIKINGTPISSDIVFTSMSPWFSQPIVKKQRPDGANYCNLIYDGTDSDSTSIQGYCKRTQANINTLKSLKGVVITVEHSIEGNRNGMVTALQPKETAGGTWLTFSMTVVAQ